MKFECVLAFLAWSSFDSCSAYSFPLRSNHVLCKASDNWSTTQLNADERYNRTLLWKCPYWLLLKWHLTYSLSYQPIRWSGKSRRRRIKSSSQKKNSGSSGSNVTPKTINTEVCDKQSPFWKDHYHCIDLPRKHFTNFHWNSLFWTTRQRRIYLQPKTGFNQ